MGKPRLDLHRIGRPAVSLHIRDAGPQVARPEKNLYLKLSARNAKVTVKV